jgi:hypothetical protein
MKRVILTMALLVAVPALAQTPRTEPTTPGPTASPETVNRNPSTILSPGRSSTDPAPAATPVPATPPSGTPPEIVATPK